MTQDNAIARILMRLILKDDRLSSRNVRVTVEGGQVMLSGHASTDAAKTAVSEIAAAIPGVCSVLNNLSVVPPPFSPDSELVESVRRALEHESRLVKESIAVSVRDGIVTLTGTVGTEMERLRVLDVALGVNGVRGVRDHLLINVVQRIEDAAAAREIRAAIRTELGEQGHSVRVAVSGEAVVLSGFVANETMRQSAEEVAQRASSNELLNEIQIEARVPVNADASVR